MIVFLIWGIGVIITYFGILIYGWKPLKMDEDDSATIVGFSVLWFAGLACLIIYGVIILLENGTKFLFKKINKIK